MITTTSALRVVPTDPAVAAADEFFDASLDAKRATARQKIARAAVVDAAAGERNAALLRGEPLKSVRLPTSCGRSVLVVWRESFRRTSDVEPLRQAFGDRFAEFIEVRESAVLAATATLNQIAEVIGDDAALRLLESGLLTLEDTASPRPHAVDQLAAALGKRDPIAKQLRAVLDGCMAAPQVRRGA